MRKADSDDIAKPVIRDLRSIFRREHNCSVDRMVCDQKLRREFLRAARGVCGTNDEFTILWSALNLRKAKDLKPESKLGAPHNPQQSDGRSLSCPGKLIWRIHDDTGKDE